MSAGAASLSSAVTRTVRVLVVDDDPVYRRIITQTLASIPGVELVAAVGTILQAKRAIAEKAADVVTIDVVLRDESGLDLLEWVRKNRADLVPILVTAGTQRDARSAVDALLLGAGGLILKPTGTDAPRQLKEAFEAAFLGLTRRARSIAPPARALAPSVFPARRDVIAIGASTGGPPVVLEILRALPKTFSVPILIAQHMPAFHMPFYSELLGRQSGRNVVLGATGMPVEPGRVYVAPGEGHMLLERRGPGLFLAIDDGPPEHNCRPAVDPLFRSVAVACGAAAVGVVVTGMGSDGCLGAQAMRARGAPIVVQDKATSVVWGMPGFIVAAGAADAVAPSGEIPDWIRRWTSNGETRT